jgi:hypothetical protein
VAAPGLEGNEQPLVSKLVAAPLELAVIEQVGEFPATPISRTASVPAGVTSSQAEAGTSASVTRRPAARDNSPSQIAVLIS